MWFEFQKDGKPQLVNLKEVYIIEREEECSVLNFKNGERLVVDFPYEKTLNLLRIHIV